MTGDPREAILEANSPAEALESAVKWLKENQNILVHDEKVTIAVIRVKGVWTAIVRYISKL